MEKFRIFHNPRCGKSRSACSLLAENGIDAEVVEYLKTAPSKDELATIVKRLSIRPEELIRRSEAVFKELYAGKVHVLPLLLPELPILSSAFASAFLLADRLQHISDQLACD